MFFQILFLSIMKLHATGWDFGLSSLNFLFFILLSWLLQPLESRSGGTSSKTFYIRIVVHLVMDYKETVKLINVYLHNEGSLLSMESQLSGLQTMK